MVFISHKHRVIFIENPRCASTTIFKAFEKVLCEYKVRQMPDDAYLTCAEVQELFPDEWRDYLKVTTYRDPFERFCSTVNHPKHSYGKYSTIKEFKRHTRRDFSCVYCKDQVEFTEGCDMIIHLNTIQKDFDAVCKNLGINTTIQLDHYCASGPHTFVGLHNIF